MSLTAQAEADLAVTLEAASDFGTVVTLTDPAGFTGTATIRGRVGDVGQVLDPDTGQAVTARHATCTLRLTSLTAAGFSSIPVAVADESLKPWLVAFATPSAPLQTYKVKQAHPDRTLGVVTMVLEFYA
jgi:hypothetical protein